MPTTKEEKLHQLFSPLLVPRKLKRRQRIQCVEIAISMEKFEEPEKALSLLLANQVIQENLGKEVTEVLRRSLRGKLRIQKDIEAARKALPTLF